MLSVRSLIALFVLTACAASQPATPWRAELTSAGGIAGKGNGSFSIDSAGKISVTTMNGTQCSYEATAEDMQRFRKLVAAAKPARWNESYVTGNMCCDRLVWTVTLEQPNSKRSASWIDDSPKPRDLVALAAALGAGADTGSIRARYVSQCAGVAR